MSSIVLSAGVRQNLLSLQNTADLMASTQNRLATGKKVNSALDNPGSFFTSQSLQNRASDLNDLLDSIGQAQKTLEAADQGITSLTKLVQSAKSIAKQARQASLGDVSYANTITGSVGSLTTATSLGGSGLNLTNGNTLTVSDSNGNTSTYTVTNTETVQEVLDGLNASANGGWTAAITGGKLEITSTSGADVTIAGSSGVLSAFGLTAGTQAATATVNTANSTRTSLESDFNAILTQIDQLATDTSYNGVNLLNGDNLKVVFNESGSSSLTISGVTFDSAGLGLSAAATNDFQVNAKVDAQIANLDTALTTLRTQAAKFGSNLSTVQTRQDFTKNLVNTLQTGADSLVLADTNEEGANLLALQTRQQLSTTALSLANQANQAVLKLF
jgi:flagellin